MRNHVFLALGYALLSCSFFVQAQNACSTAAVPRGTCIPVKECQTVINILLNSKRSQQDLDYIKALHCGFAGNDPKVCCPIDETASERNVEAKEDPKKLLPLRTVCGISSEDRIFGGEKTELDEFPWMALLSYERADGVREFSCGGTLINDRYILTAGHCVKYPVTKRLKLVSIRLGEYDTKATRDCVTYAITNEQICADTPQDIGVEEIIPHEKYEPTDKNQYNDIALVRLSVSVNYTDYIKPICLPTTDQNTNFDGMSLTASGWGVTENLTSSNVKLKVQVPVTSLAKCNEIYKPTTNTLTERQLCAGGSKGKDTCKGDSGGPLMHYSVSRSANWEQVGVVSYGRFPCGIDGWPGVYTRVDKYMDWIYSKLRR